MSVSNRKFKIAVLVMGLIGIQIGSRLRLGTVSTELEFALGLASMIYFGRSIQVHALAQMKKFRVDFRVFLWLSACVAFWYSTVIWVWWSRRTVTFPLFLLSDSLVPTYYFKVVPLIVILGLLFESREK